MSLLKEICETMGKYRPSLESLASSTEGGTENRFRQMSLAYADEAIDMVTAAYDLSVPKLNTERSRFKFERSKNGIVVYNPEIVDANGHPFHVTTIENTLQVGSTPVIVEMRLGLTSKMFSRYLKNGRKKVEVMRQAHGKCDWILMLPMDYVESGSELLKKFRRTYNVVFVPFRAQDFRDALPHEDLSDNKRDVEQYKG